eukprot:621845-Pyramimonas_sp.AAC.1
MICASRSASDSSWVVGSRPPPCGGSASGTGTSLALLPGAGASANSSNFAVSWSKLARDLVDSRHCMILECADPVASRTFWAAPSAS